MKRLPGKKFYAKTWDVLQKASKTSVFKAWKILNQTSSFYFPASFHSHKGLICYQSFQWNGRVPQKKNPFVVQHNTYILSTQNSSKPWFFSCRMLNYIGFFNISIFCSLALPYHPNNFKPRLPIWTTDYVVLLGLEILGIFLTTVDNCFLDRCSLAWSKRTSEAPTRIKTRFSIFSTINGQFLLFLWMVNTFQEYSLNIISFHAYGEACLYVTTGVHG